MTRDRDLLQATPAPVKRPLKRAWRAFARTTSPLRAQPTFLIIGAQRCGTTSLYDYLLRHPAVSGAMSKEVHYFDAAFHRSPSWYRSHFPLRVAAKSVIGEATPYYLFHPLIPRRVYEFDPGLKLIAILRDPVARAISQYHHERNEGHEPLSLADALDREAERLGGEEERLLADESYVSYNHQHYSYVARGRYKEQLDRWAAFFPAEQLLVVTVEDLLRDPQGTVDQVLGFLGVPPKEFASFPRRNSLSYGEAAPETIERLERIFAQPTQDLSRHLGRDLGWGPDRSQPRSETESAGARAVSRY